MSTDIERILTDLRRHREKLADLVEDIAETGEEREALYRAVDRIRKFDEKNRAAQE